MKKRPLKTLLLIGALSLFGRESDGTIYHYTGVSCVALGELSDYGGAGLGIRNPSTELRINAICPITGHIQLQGTNITNYRMYYTDQSDDIFPGEGLEGYAGGYLVAVNTADVVWTSSALYSCSTAGGCSSPANNFVGTGYLGWTNPVSSATNIVSLYGFFVIARSEFGDSLTRYTRITY